MKILQNKSGQSDLMFSKTVLLIITIIIILVVLLVFSGIARNCTEAGCRLGTEFLNFFEDIFNLPKSSLC